MLDFALNAKTHDLIIADGDLIAIDNAERVAQQIKIQLLTWLGEWFLDITHGVLYLDYILVKNPNIELARSIFKEQIMKVDDVDDVTSLEIYYNATERTMAVEYEASTSYGLVTRKEKLCYGDT